MTRKLSLIVIPALCCFLFLTSCYPELSVQQYDQLKEDLEVLNHQSAAMDEELAYINAENGLLKENNVEIATYVDFMMQLLSTQNSESLLNGEFDVQALVDSKEVLLASSANLSDGNIYRYLSIINEENEAETMGAYYQTLSTCIKNIKQKLGEIPSSANSNGN